MRSTWLLWIPLVVAAVCGCSRDGNAAGRESERGVELDQRVTHDPKAQDVVFKDFSNNWRQFISKAPELALPVVPSPERAPLWQPVVHVQCLYSEDAGGTVPQVTLTWNDWSPPSSSRAGALTGVKTAANAAAPTEPQPATRFDLTLHHDGFARNYYSSGLSTEQLKRFMLPENSALVQDTAAVMLTGPGLFPKLMEFRTQMLTERNTNRAFAQRTLVLRDLNPGLTYTIRRSTLRQHDWGEDGRSAFLTPICPNSF